MSKLRKSILIIGIIIVALAASVGTAVGLYATGSIVTDPIELTFSVKDAQKVYDGTPLKASEYRLSSGELTSGHTAVVEFVGEQTDVGKSESGLTVKILDRDGFNVTSDYIIKVESGNLTVDRKAISVNLPDQKVVYNGSAVMFADYEILEDGGSLVSGHKIYGSADAGLMNVGDTLPEDLRPLVFDAAGKDVTFNYDVTFTMGEIEVIPREIAVRPVSVSKVYDGRESVCDSIEYIDGTLVEGQYATYTINHGYNYGLTDAGSILTEVTDFKVFQNVGGEEIEVTSNYVVDTSETGFIEITPRPLTVVAKSAEWVYDGKTHSLINDADPLSVEGLAEDDLLTGVAYVGELKNVGEAKNVIGEVNLNTSLENYIITRVDGVLKITPYNLTVTTGSGEKYYDGDPLYNTEILADLANEEHDITIQEGSTLPQITDSGSLENSYPMVITDADHVDVTSNYIIDFVYGTLTVNKMPVTVTFSEGETVQYDGLEHTPSIENPEYFKFEAIDEEATAKLALTVEDFEVDTFEKMIDAREEPYQYSVKFADASLSRNYELIVTNYGYLKITPIAITITTGSEVCEIYQGQPVYNSSATVTSGALLVGHELVVPENVPKLDTVGTLPNEFECTISETATRRDVTHNYDIEYVYGTLELKKATVIIKTKAFINENALIFNGKEQVITPAQAVIIETAGSILTLDDLIIKIDGDKKLIDTGDYTYTVDFRPDYFAADKFTIEYHNLSGKVIAIKPLAVEVRIKDVVKQYDGTNYVLNPNEVVTYISDIETGLTRDDIVIDRPEDAPSINAVDTYNYTVKICDAKNKPRRGVLNLVETDDLTNYTLTVKNEENRLSSSASIKVTPFAITFTAKSLDIIYDGKVHTQSGYDCDKLANPNHKIEVDPDSVTEFKEVCDTDNALEFTIVDTANGNADVTDNYNIDNKAGKAIIKPYTINLKSRSETFTYDGEEHKGKYDCDQLANEDHFIRVTSLGIINVGELENALTYEIIDKANSNQNVTANYVVNQTWGKIVINPYRLSVKARSASIVYDGTQHSLPYCEYGALANAAHRLNIIEASVNEIDNVGSVVNSLDYTITTSGGAEVTANYILDKTDGTITITPLFINFASESLSTTYDGNPHEQRNFKHDPLAAGHTIQLLEPVPSQIEVGSIVNVLNFKIKDGAGHDVTANYTINKVYGTISVKSYHLNFTSKSLTVTYDGEEHSQTEYDSDGLAPNHKIVVDKDTAPKIKNKGSITNALKFKIVDTANGNAVVTDNYDINQVNGTITVNAYHLNVTTLSLKCDYDGLEHSEENFKHGALANEHHVINKVGDAPKLKYVGTVSNVFEVVISDGAENVTANYVINYNYGTLTITQSKITVKSEGATRCYDNSPLTNAARYVSSGALPEGHTIRGTLTADLPSITNVGKINNDYPIVILNGTEDVTSQFDITNAYGVLEITPAPVQANFGDYPDGVLVYNGSVLQLNIANLTPVFTTVDGAPTDLVSEDDVQIKYSAPILNAGSYTFTLELKAINQNIIFTAPTRVVNVGKFEASVRLIQPAVGLSYNNKVQTLDINHMLKIDTGSALLTVDDFVLKTDREIKDAGTYTVTAEFKDNNMLANFALESTPLDVTVSKADVVVSLKNITRVYDGVEHTIVASEALILTDDSPVTSDDFIIVRADDAPIKDAGTYTYNVALKSAESASNYNIVVTRIGNVTVKKADVKVTLKDYEYDYTDNAYKITVADAITSISSKLLGVDAFALTGDIENKNAATYFYNVTLKTEYKNNFEFTAPADGKMVIKPLSVSVTLNNLHKKYTGVAQTLGVDTAVASISASFITNDMLRVKFADGVTAPTAAGEYYYSVEFVTPNPNYKLVNNVALYEIEKLTVNVELNSLSEEYDGESHTLTLDSAVRAIDSDVITNDKLQVVVIGGKEIKNAGEYFYYVKLKTANPSVVIVQNSASYTVTKLNVTVSTGDFEGTYDAETHKAILPVLRGAVAGHVAKPVKAEADLPKIEDCGIVDNVYECAIYTADNTDVTKNYQITYVYGTLKLNRRNVTIGYKDGLEKDYDGNSHRISEFYVNQTEAITVNDPITGLQANTDFTVVCSGALRDAGVYTYEAKPVSAKALNNYVFNYNGIGQVTIKKVGFSITLKNYGEAGALIYYDGTNHVIDVNDAVTFVASDAVNAALALDNLTVSDFKISQPTIKDVNVGGYDYTVEMVNVTKLKNYNVSVDNTGKYTLTPLAISVTLRDFEFTYNGSVPTISDYVTSVTTTADGAACNLVPNALFVANPAGLTKNAGNYTYTVTLRGDGSQNFTMEEATGNIVIKRCAARIVLAPVTCSSTGNTAISNASSLITVQLVGGDTIQITRAVAMISKASKTCTLVQFEFTFIDGEGNDVTDNYTHNWTGQGSITSNATIINDETV